MRLDVHDVNTTKQVKFVNILQAFTIVATVHGQHPIEEVAVHHHRQARDIAKALAIVPERRRSCGKRRSAAMASAAASIAGPSARALARIAAASRVVVFALMRRS